jgi:hypothetical protein
MAKARPKPPSTEKEVRATLQRFFRKLARLLLNPTAQNVLEDLIRLQIGLLTAFRKESERKTRSKLYLGLRRYMLNLSTQPLGALADINLEQLSVLEEFLDVFTTGLRHPQRRPKVNPATFVSLQKKIFVTPAKRGPKSHTIFDKAYRRWKRKESLTAIALDLAPDDYAEDSAGTLQRFSNAVRRRDREAAKKRQQRKRNSN